MTLEALYSILAIAHTHRMCKKNNIDVLFYNHLDHQAFKQEVHDFLADDILAFGTLKRGDGLFVIRLRGYIIYVFNIKNEEQVSGFDLKFH